MSFDPFTAAFDLGKIAIEKIWPDANKRAEELRKLEEMRQAGNLAELNAYVQLMIGQIEINKIEAQHPNIFVSGWRPFVGWVCAFAIAWSTIFHPLLIWVWAFAEMAGKPPPVLETSALVALVSSMLGVGTMRSHDKKHGVDTKQHG
jgi:hypothetical protein